MASEERIHWYRSPIPKDQLRQLTQREDLRPLLHIGGQLVFSAATGVGTYLAYLHLSWPFVVLGIYIHSLFFVFFGPYAAVHELSHKTAFKTTALNEFFIMLCSLLTWTNYVKFRVSHMKHHQFTVFAGRDLEVVLPKIIYPLNWLSFLTISFSGILGFPGLFTTIGETIRHARGVIEGEWEERIFSPSDPDSRRKLFNWARILLLFHAALAILFLVSHFWLGVFLVTFPIFIATWLGALTNLPQHIGLKPNVPDFRICCRTMILHPFLSFFYWNMNYHTEHHMYAAVPFYNLPKLHNAMKHELPEIKKGLWANWRDILPIVKEQRKNPDFCVVPQLPK